MARVVFDLDGTLIDSVPDIHGVANAVLAAWDEAPMPLEQARAFVGNGVGVFIDKLRADRGIPDDAQADMVAAFLARYDDAVTLTEIFAGVPEALQTLSAAGHRLGICTNKPERPACSVLAHLQLDRFFEVVVGGDTLPTRKPDPAHLTAALDALGDGAAIYVGDSEVDAETADRAGVPFLLYSEGYRKTPAKDLPHAAVFRDFSDLPALVTRFASAD